MTIRSLGYMIFFLSILMIIATLPAAVSGRTVPAQDLVLAVAVYVTAWLFADLVWQIAVMVRGRRSR